MNAIKMLYLLIALTGISFVVLVIGVGIVNEVF